MTDSGPARPSSAFGPTDIVLFLVLSAMWGLSFLFIKVAVADMAPVWVVAGRTSIGAVILVVILRARGTRLPRSRRALGHLLVLAVLGNALPWTMVAWAEESLPSGLTAVVNALTPASTLAIAASVGVERLTARRILGLALALVGTVVVVSGELGAPERLVALLVVVAATVLYGAGAVYAKQTVSGRYPPLAVATGQVALAALVSVPVAALAAPLPRPDTVSGGAAVSLIALGVLGTGLAFLVFYTLIDTVGATNATMVTYAIPVVGLLAGWIVLEESVGPAIVAGTVIVIAGVWLAQRRSAPPPEVPAEAVVAGVGDAGPSAGGADSGQ